MTEASSKAPQILKKRRWNSNFRGRLGRSLMSKPCKGRATELQASSERYALCSAGLDPVSREKAGSIREESCWLTQSIVIDFCFLVVD